MKFCIILPSFFFFSTLILLTSCTTSANQSDREILDEFNHLSKETQKFFNSNTKVLCACLKEHKTVYNELLKVAKPLTDDLKTAKRSLNDEAVQEEIESKLMPGLAKFNNCNADAPDPSDEAVFKMQEDLLHFSGASVPGGKSDNKMHRLNLALLRKHCPEQQELGSNMDQLSKTLFASPYGQ
jgi:hypothetical protein